MEFKRAGAAALLLLAPVMAAAKPAYLKCKVEGNEGYFIVTLDEDAARVTMPDGEVYDKAAFSAEEISFGKSERSRSSMTSDEFSINRMTLAYRNIWTNWSSTDGKKTVTDTKGQCEVTKAPERKI